MHELGEAWRDLGLNFLLDTTNRRPPKSSAFRALAPVRIECRARPFSVGYLLPLQTTVFLPAPTITHFKCLV